jgi:hypothetical protein
MTNEVSISESEAPLIELILGLTITSERKVLAAAERKFRLENNIFSDP